MGTHTDTLHFWPKVASVSPPQSPAPTMSTISTWSLPSWPQPQPSLPVQLTPAAMSQLQSSLSPVATTVWPSLVLPMPPGSEASSPLSGSRSVARGDGEASSSCTSRARCISERRPSGDSGRPKHDRRSSNNNSSGSSSINNSSSSSSSSNNNSSGSSNSRNRNNNNSSNNSINSSTAGISGCESPQSVVASRPAAFGIAAAPSPRPPRAYGHPLTAAAAAEVTWRGRRKDPSSHGAQSPQPSSAHRQFVTFASCSPGVGPPADPKRAHEGGQDMPSHPGGGAGGRAEPQSPLDAIISPLSSSAPRQAVMAPPTAASERSAAPATTTALVTTTAALDNNNATAFATTAPDIAPPTAAFSTCTPASPAAIITTVASVASSAVYRTPASAVQAASMPAPFRGCKCWQAGICTNAPCSIDYLCETRIAIRRAGLFCDAPWELAPQPGLFRDAPEPLETLHLQQLALCPSSPHMPGTCPVALNVTDIAMLPGVCNASSTYAGKQPSPVSSLTPSDLATISTSNTSTSDVAFAKTATNTSSTLRSGGESLDDSRDSAILLSKTGHGRNERTMTSVEVAAKLPLPAVPEVWFRTAALIYAKDRAAASPPLRAVGMLTTARRSPSMSTSESNHRVSTTTAAYPTSRLLDAEPGRVTSPGAALALQQPSNQPRFDAPGCQSTTAVSGRWPKTECTEETVNNGRQFNLGNGHRQATIVWGVEHSKVAGSMRDGPRLSQSSQGYKSQWSLQKTGSSPMAAEPSRLPLVGSALRSMARAMESAHAAHAVVVVMLVAGMNERGNGVLKEALEEADAAAVMAAAVAGDPGPMAGAEVGSAVPTLHQVKTYVSLANSLPSLKRSFGSAGGLCGAVTADSTEVWWVQYNAAFSPAE
ncbi:hypothetical protein Vretimale_2863 [Volvox reticuliferus]|uniref:Uncharacterized protein n=1 Tax=Volvox reticuliferus TaxID=1737510 RepID=A0A8J4BZE5_9CHLO|nr:hypothetical protein Vretifemale_1869 [Volvox reticuliferus]GIL97118.1 hypothetical protein Vretimale_2863 [Volvox reticuliferus]